MEIYFARRSGGPRIPWNLRFRDPPGTARSPLRPPSDRSASLSVHRSSPESERQLTGLEEYPPARGQVCPIHNAAVPKMVYARKKRFENRPATQPPIFPMR